MVIPEEAFSCLFCPVFTDEEEDGALGKVEEQRKMSQDSPHHATGNGLGTFLGMLASGLSTFLSVAFLPL